VRRPAASLPRLRWRDPVFWSTTLRLALPVAVQNLLISSFALVDTLLVFLIYKHLSPLLHGRR